MKHPIKRRNICILAGCIPLLSGIAPTLSYATQPRIHFYAGCFYDTAASPDSQLIKHLVAPERRARNLGPESFGAEMGPLAREILNDNQEFRRAANLSMGEAVGNPLVIGIQRAQHEVTTVRAEGVPDEFLTVVSVTLSLDVMTDKAAFRNSNRFESLYSTMLVVNQLIQARQIPDDTALADHYRNVFTIAVKKLLEVAERAFEDRREKASAIFQVRNMVLPDPLPPEIEQLVAGGLSAAGSPGETGRAGELIKLSREFQHIYNLMLVDALDQRKIRDLSLLPPASPWGEARVLRQLEQRLGINAEILSQADPSRMNGYEIRAGITKTNTVKVGENQIGRVMQLNVSMASRIVRNPGEGEVIHVPLAIANARDKVATGVGYRTFNEINGMERSATRDVMMQSFRDGARHTASELVDLMIATAKEIH